MVTGHTHLARAIDLGGGRLYLNSGTWIRLMRFTDAMLKDTASFAPVYQLLLDGRMAALDGALFGGQPLVMDLTTEVEITQDATGVVGRLNRIVGDGSGAPDTLKELRHV